MKRLVRFVPTTDLNCSLLSATVTQSAQPVTPTTSIIAPIEPSPSASASASVIAPAEPSPSSGTEGNLQGFTGTIGAAADPVTSESILPLSSRKTTAERGHILLFQSKAINTPRVEGLTTSFTTLSREAVTTKGYVSMDFPATLRYSYPSPPSNPQNTCYNASNQLPNAQVGAFQAECETQVRDETFSLLIDVFDSDVLLYNLDFDAQANECLTFNRGKIAVARRWSSRM